MAFFLTRYAGLLLLLAASVIATAPNVCPDSWVLSNGRCYHASSVADRKTSLSEAQSYCESLDAQLASIASSTEQNTVRNLCPNAGGADCWLGATRIPNYGVEEFEWETGLSWGVYAYWQITPGVCTRDENNNCVDVCTQVRRANGRWETIPCTLSTPNTVICVKEALCQLGYMRSQEYNLATGARGRCSRCPAGSYADTPGSLSCTPCPAGTYGAAGATTSECTGLCRMGYYCPEGTAINQDKRCPEGKYGGSLGLKDESECQTCAAGYQCTASAANIDEFGRISLGGDPTACAEGRCSNAGELCVSCPIGYYCPTTGLPCPGLECGENNYCSRVGRSSPVQLPAGALGLPLYANTTFTAAAACPAGHYCVNGLPYLCPSGTWHTGSGYRPQCNLCDAGWFCPAGSTSNRFQDCAWTRNLTLLPDMAKYYCPQGTPEILEAPYGYYTTPVNWNPWNRQQAVYCPPESNDYCVNGTRYSIMSTNRCGGYSVSEGYPCSLPDPRDTPIPPACAEDTPRRYTTLNYTLHPDFADFPVRMTFLGYEFLGKSTSPNCNPTSIEKNQDLFYMENEYPTFGDLYFRRQGFNKGLNNEVCSESRSQTSYQLKVLYETEGFDPVTGVYRNISYLCQPRIIVANKNEPPYFEVLTRYLQIKEKSIEGSPVTVCDQEGINAGCPPCSPSVPGSCETTDEIVAKDPDFFSSFTHFIKENDPETPDREPVPEDEVENPIWKFSIESCSGKITVRNPENLKYATAPRLENGARRYYHRVGATDEFGWPSQQYVDVYIYVINVNDPPILVGSTEFTFTIPENSPVGAIFDPAVPPYEDEDEDILNFFDAASYEPLEGYTDGRAYFSFNTDSKLRVTTLGATILDFENQMGSFAVTVTGADGNGGFDTKTYAIEITDANDPPVFTEAGPFYIAENRNGVVCGANSPSGVCGAGTAVAVTDQDRVSWPSDIPYFQLADDAGGKFMINMGTGQISATAALNYEATPLLGIIGQQLRGYVVKVTATSNGHEIDPTPRSTTVNVQIIVVNVNEPPTFIRNPVIFTALETHPVGLALTAIPKFLEDPDDANLQPGESQNPITYSISPDQAEGSAASKFQIVNGPTTNSMSLVLIQSLDYEQTPACSYDPNKRCLFLTIRAFDGLTTISGDLTVEVLDINEAPFYSSGSSLGSVEIYENIPLSGASIDLNYPGTVFFGQDPDIYRSPFVYLAYEVSGGNGQSYFEVVNMNSPSVNSNQTHFYVRTKSGLAGVKFNYESGVTRYLLQVRVRDTGGSSFIGKQCTTDDNCGPDAYCENQRCYERCYTASGSTPRGDGPELAFFCNYTGSTQTKFPFESSVGTVTINVLDANDPPVLIGATQTQPFCRWNTSIVFASTTAGEMVPIKSLVNATYDEDPVDKVFIYAEDEEFEASGYSGDLWAVGFHLDPETGRLSLPAGTDLSAFEEGDDLAGRITISDGRGGMSTCVIVCLLTDYNEPPHFLPPFFAEVNENLAPGTFIIQANAEDDGGAITFSIATNPNFVINATTGVITTSSQANLNFEVQSEYSILVRARDTRNAESTQVFIITLLDVNDPPQFRSTMPTVIKFPEQTSAGYEIVASLTDYVLDPDAGDSVTFSLAPNEEEDGPQGPFTINPTTGRISVAADFVGVTDFETLPNSWRATIVITDQDGLTASSTVTFALLDVNERPVFFSPTFTLDIAENLLSGSIIDLLSFSSDPDANDVRKFYLLEGNDEGRFSLSLQGSLAIVVALDYEDVSQYNLLVQVRDVAGLHSNASVVVNVVNVNDLTITSVSPRILSTCNVSEWVTLTGTNYGLKNPSVSQKAIVIGRYRASGRSVDYISPECKVTVANTEIQCRTAPGVGGSLIWNITVSVPGDVNLQDQRVIGSLSTSISYPNPAITDATGTFNMRTSGGDSFKVFGTCLGSASDGIVFPTSGTDRDFVRMCTPGGSCVDPTCSYNNSQLVCISSPGIGASLSLQVRIGGLSSVVVPNMASYARPSVISINIPVVSTLGILPTMSCCQVCNPTFVPCGDSCIAAGTTCQVSQGCACQSTFDTRHLIISGDNFGPLGSVPDSVLARLEYSNVLTGNPVTLDRAMTNCVVTKPFLEVSCTGIAPGVGYNMPVLVSFGSQQSTNSTARISYEAPRAISMAGPYTRATTQGGQIIEIRGQNFGPVCGGSSSTSLVDPCLYVDAEYTARSRNPLTGELIVYQPLCRVVSQTLIFCVTTPGTGADLEWSIWVGNQPMIDIELFLGAYAPPVVGAYTGPGAENALTVGGQEIYLAGSQFGPINGAAIVARYGLNPSPEFLASNCTVVTANELIRCTTGPGAGTDLKWYVVVDGQSSVNAQTNYGLPAISAITGSGVNSSTDGGGEVFIDGVNFGPSTSPGPYLDRVVYGPLSFPFAYEATCTIVVAHTRIRCLTAPGVGFGMFWQVTIRQQTSVMSTMTTNYKKPSLLSLSQSRANTKGGTQIKLTGLNMALCDPQSTPFVRFGLQSIEISNRRMGISPSTLPLVCPTPNNTAYERKEVTFIVPEMTSDRQVEIGYYLSSARLDYQTFSSENTLTFTYDDPVIFDVYASPTIEVTRLRVTITGRNFCNSEMCCRTVFDGNDVWISDVESHTHEQIVFIIRSTGQVQIRCGDYITPPRSFTAEDPYIIATMPKLSTVAFDTVGGAHLIVWGLYFGLEPEVFVGGRPAEINSHESVVCDDQEFPDGADFASTGTTIFCWRSNITIPAGEGKAERLTIKNGNQTSHFHSADFENVRYAPPVVASSVGISGTFGRRLETACCFKTDGSDGATLTFGGTNLGTQGTVWLGGVNNIRATVISWTHTQVVAKIPPGEGKNLQVYFFSGDQQPVSGPLDMFISYAAPTITSVDRGVDPVPTTGGSILTVIGNNFGRPFVSECEDDLCTSNAPAIQIVGSTITFCDVISGSQTSNSIQCVVPVGAGSNLTVKIIVADQIGERANAFSYDPPVIHTVTPLLVPTSGRDESNQKLIMTITGENFGITDLCVKIVDPRPSEPNFAIANRPVTQPVLFGCAQLDGTPPPVLLSSPSHSMIQFYVPEFHGKNVKILVVAGGQESPVPGTFSYISPIVDTVQVLNRTWPSGAGRRIGSTAFSDVDNANSTTELSYGDWTNEGASRNLCRTSTFYGMRGYGWKETITIQASGLYNRRLVYYNSSTCASNRQLFAVSTTGKYTDLSEHEHLHCSRLYFDRLDSINLEPLSAEGVTALTSVLPGCECDSATYVIGSSQGVTQCFLEKLGSSATQDTSGKPRPCQMITNLIKPGYGIYVIADNTKLYMSEHPLDSQLEATLARTTFSLPDMPTVEVENVQAIDTPTGPTEGCYRYERQDAFLARLAIAEREGGTTTRQCEEPAYMILTGSNFGVSKPTLASGLRVLLVSMDTGVVYEASTTSRGGDAGQICETCSHTHNKLVVQIPPGAGKNLQIRVEVGLGEYTQLSQTPYPLFHYSPPFILEAVPGTVGRSKGFLNAEGEGVVLRGYNFGGKPSNVTILLSGKQCPNAGWVSGSLDVDGTPFLACSANRDVVGPKSVMVCVAGQATVNRLYRSDALKIKTGQSLGIWLAGVGSSYAISYSSGILSTVNTQCKSSSNGTRYYADMFGLCQPCPVGSNCADLPETRFGPPPAESTFYRFAYPTWDPETSSVPERTQQRCAPETWSHNNLTSEHPSAMVSEVCYDYVRCTPPESCTGANTCSLGYQYALEECIKFHGPGVEPLVNTSLVPKFAYDTLSNGSLCSIYMDVYTGEWKGRDLDCNPTGKTCKPGNPEYCSECKVLFREGDGDNDEPVPFGFCKCIEPERCAFCTLYQFFRFQNECKKCPDNPALLIAMFFVLAAVCIVGGYILQRKNFNLAFISIGVDYFQVLALFATTNVQWPPIILELFNLFSLLNFNIDITAPECLVPTLEYDFKWYLVEAIPLMMAALLMMIHFGYIGYKLYIKGHRADLYSHVARLYAVYFTALYYLYINVTKKALDVFNCNPADPDDGYFYATFTSLSCEGSVCRCGEGLQATLVPWAILALIMYAFGFPAFIASRLLKYRYEILEDQYLRANGIGESRLTNPNAYDVRKRYSKLYFHFKPELNYWILVVLARKFGIVFAGLMFRGNTGFQLAVVLLVLFVSYVLQVTHRPYMSSGEREKVKEGLDVFVKKAITNVKYSWYPEIQQNVLEARRRFLKKKRKQLMVRFDPKGEKEDHVKHDSNEEPADGFQKMELKKNATNYFFDYNTVEASLLACAVLIALIGVMFESGRFNLNRPDLKGQQEFLAWAVIIVVIGSIVYYIVVFFGEMWQITGSNRFIRLFMRKKKEDKVTNEDIDDTIILDTNPIHAELASSPIDIKQKQDEMAGALKRAGEQYEELRSQLIQERKKAAEDLARFEKLVKQGLVVESEEDRMDDEDQDGSSRGGGSAGARLTVSSGKKGRGKAGMSDLLRGRTVNAGSALEQDRHNRAGRGTTVSNQVGTNPKLSDAYKDSISFQEEMAAGNPIFQAERGGGLQEQGAQALRSMRSSFVSFGSALRRKTMGTEPNDKAPDAGEEKTNEV